MKKFFSKFHIFLNDGFPYQNFTYSLKTGRNVEMQNDRAEWSAAARFTVDPTVHTLSSWSGIAVKIRTEEEAPVALVCVRKYGAGAGADLTRDAFLTEIGTYGHCCRKLKGTVCQIIIIS